MEDMGAVKLSRFKRVCVFCGSSTGKKICYKDAALELGQELVKRRVDLVYGGGSAGLMGLVSQEVHRGGGHVLGIIPRTLMCKEVGLLNVEGYYNSLLTFIDKAVDDGFIMPSQRHIIVSAPTARELVQKLEDYVPVHKGVVAKARWEAEQVELHASLRTDIIGR
ncbi:hypothetical protein RJ639_020142 [Escallonia herrerae]|uniref:cytokinin riboside 5'-monophosphate phosphoribohydrolase n=1 Tax=Escallonia herrerae TaxID=1293975 RepID=A0AA88V9S8_9ASTE|nr:hypothetical protein RJ639_020142 [Escallonia herrerae]